MRRDGSLPSTHSTIESEKERPTRVANHTLFDDGEFGDEENVVSEVGRQLSRPLSNADSVWVSHSLSKTREALFVIIVCMTQVTVRTYWRDPLAHPLTALVFCVVRHCQPIHPHSTQKKKERKRKNGSIC